MEQDPQNTPEDRLQLLDSMITAQRVGREFHDEIWSAVAAVDAQPPAVQLDELIALHDRAYHMEYRLRAGVQSAILDRALQLPGVHKVPELQLDLHMRQVEALVQDLGILFPGYYPPAELETRTVDTVFKLHGHARQALALMSSRTYRHHPYKLRCQTILKMVPLDYRR